MTTIDGPLGDRLAEPARKIATQTATTFVLLSPDRRVEAAMLPMLAYMADRLNAERYGYRISRGDLYARKTGPVVLEMAWLVDGTTSYPGWSDMVRTQDGQATLLRPVDDDYLDELSVATVDTINSTWRTFGHMTADEFRVWAGGPDGLPEWKPDGIIPLQAMMEAAGMTPEIAAQCVEEERFHEGVETTFREANLGLDHGTLPR